METWQKHKTYQGHQGKNEKLLPQCLPFSGAFVLPLWGLLIYFEHDVFLKRLEIVARGRRHVSSAKAEKKKLMGTQ